MLSPMDIFAETNKRSMTQVEWDAVRRQAGAQGLQPREMNQSQLTVLLTAIKALPLRKSVKGDKHADTRD